MRDRRPGDAFAAEQQHAEEGGLDGEGREALVGEEPALDRPRSPSELGPVGAELELHDDAGHHPEPEGNGKDPQPEVEQFPVDRPRCGDVQRLEEREPCRQPDREGREDDVERDREGELHARQDQGGKIHRGVTPVRVKGCGRPVRSSTGRCRKCRRSRRWRQTSDRTCRARLPIPVPSQVSCRVGQSERARLAPREHELAEPHDPA